MLGNTTSKILFPPSDQVTQLEVVTKRGSFVEIYRGIDLPSSCFSSSSFLVSLFQTEAEKQKQDMTDMKLQNELARTKMGTDVESFIISSEVYSVVLHLLATHHTS